jgi:hypothetical protein
MTCGSAFDAALAARARPRLFSLDAAGELSCDHLQASFLLSAPLLIARCTVRACLLVKQCGCNGLMRT